MPTDDKLMPKNLRLAKHIRYKITERAYIGVMDDVDKGKFIPTDEFTSFEDCTALESAFAPSDGEVDALLPVFSGVLVVEKGSISPPSNSVIEPVSVKPRPIVQNSVGRGSRDDEDIFQIVKMHIVRDEKRREEKCK